MKKERHPREVAKLVLITIAILLVIGFVAEKIADFVAGEKLKPRVDYTTVDEVRMDYVMNGQGECTIVFDGALGTNLETWEPITKALKEDDVTTFVYNRRGYGYSGSGERRTIEEQAQDLKILLRKSGAVEPYILVGEEYGSLVLTSFAEQFPEAVAGAVLVNPLVEEEINTKEYKKSQFLNKLRRKIESIGSRVGLTMLLDKVGLDITMEEYEDALSDQAREEFIIQRTKKNYTSAVYNELVNLAEGLSNTQKAGVFSGKPYYLLLKQESSILASLGDESLTKVYITKSKKSLLSLNDQENVLQGIRDVLKEVIELNN
jgi:pimeloyl-ACP methyl ester carboxylesterase